MVVNVSIIFLKKCHFSYYSVDILLVTPKSDSPTGNLEIHQP